MTLDQLRIFLAVVAQGGMSPAARHLHMTQSAVSAAIAALEGRHGMRLFDRIGRGLVLTHEGRTFVPAAEAVLAQAETARALLADLADETRGRLRLHASQTVANYWLPPRLVTLHEAHPGIEIELHLGNTSQVAQAIHDGAGDIGLVEGEVEHGELLARVVTRDELVLVGAAANAILQGPGFGAGDYTRLTWVLREPGSGTRAEVEAHFAEAGLSPQDLDIAFESPSNEALLSAVAAGRYVTMVSERAAAPARGIIMRRVDWAAPPRRAFSVLLHPRRHRTRAMVEMLGILGLAQRR